ncbi:MAG: CpaD family pilus assembly lipoprotein [Phenylobacterium sp.]
MTTSLRWTAGLVLAGALAGCATPPSGMDAEARLPTEQYRAEVSEQPNEIALAIHASGLSPAQRTALTGLANDYWNEDSRSSIDVQVPAEEDPAVARRFGEQVRDHLVRQGVPDEAVRLVGGEGRGVMRVGYLRRVAVVPTCGEQWSDLKNSATNRVQPNFGCTVTSNIAVQVADPNDLLGPQPLGPADAGRRGVVTERYRQGQKTGAAIDDAARGAVSSVN